MKVLVIILTILTLVLAGGVGWVVYSNIKISSDIKELNSNIEGLTTEKTRTFEDLNALKQEIENMNEKIANNGTNDPNEDIYTKILTGDFSGVAGEYVNSKGETKTLLSNGLIVGEENVNASSIRKNTDGIYEWAIGDGFGGFGRAIYPIGIPVIYVNSEGRNLPDDTSKIRLHEGQDGPFEEYHIYYKK